MTGTPGTGKTTIARKLANALDAKYISLTSYVTRHKLYTRLDQARQSKVVDVAATRETLARDISPLQGLVIVDSHLTEGIVPQRMVRVVIVLRCHPRILEKRLRRKRWAATKIRENVLAEVLDSCLMAAVAYYGIGRIIQIDTSKIRANESVALAKRAVLLKTRSRTGHVDWIKKLEKEGLLDGFLRESKK